MLFESWESLLRVLVVGGSAYVVRPEQWLSH